MIVDVPFTFRVDFKSPGGRAWKRKEFRDSVPVELRRVPASQVRTFHLVGTTDFLAHDGKLYERVPNAHGGWPDRPPLWGDPAWLASAASPVLPHDPLDRPCGIEKVPLIAELSARERRPVDRDSRAAAAVARGEELLVAGDDLYRHSAGPYLYLSLDKPKTPKLISLDPANPQTGVPVRFGTLFAPNDADLALELGARLGLPVDDASAKLGSRLSGLSLRHDESDLAMIAHDKAIAYIDDMQARNVEPSLMFAIADYREIARPTLEQKRELLSAFVAASKGIKDLKLADRHAYALTLARIERLAELDSNLSHGTPMP